MTKQRRAVSEIIVSLLLLAITVVGGLLVFGLVSSNDSISGLEGNIEEAGKRGTAVKVIGFDTRDGALLSSIPAFSNSTGDRVLTTGSDSIVVKIRNTSVGSLTIHGVSVNEIRHTWDSGTSGKTFAGGTLSTHPGPGKFSLIVGTETGDQTGLVQFSGPKLLAGQDTRLIITLASTVSGTGNIKLTEGIRIDIQASDFDPVRFIIPAGSAS